MDFHPTWGPSKFFKADHPLQIMVLYRLNVMSLVTFFFPLCCELGSAEGAEALETSCGGISSSLQVEEVWDDWLHCQPFYLHGVPGFLNSFCTGCAKSPESRM